MAWRSRASRSDGNRRADSTGEQRQTTGLHHRAVVTAQPPLATSSMGTGSLPRSFPTLSPSACSISWKRQRRASQQGWGLQQASQGLVFKDVLRARGFPWKKTFPSPLRLLQHTMSLVEEALGWLERLTPQGRLMARHRAISGMCVAFQRFRKPAWTAQQPSGAPRGAAEEMQQTPCGPGATWGGKGGAPRSLSRAGCTGHAPRVARIRVPQVFGSCCFSV